MGLKEEVNRILRDIENPDGGGVIVTFDERPWYNETESEKQGRPVFENRIYITKHKDNLSVNIARALDEDIAMYPKQFAAFQAKRKVREEGIPIGMLPGITPSQIATCEACRVFTVERLAAADEQIMSVLRFPELKQRALEYLGRNDKMKEMQAEIERLQKQLKGNADEPVNNGAKRRGRKPAIREAVSGDKQLEQRNAAAS